MFRLNRHCAGAGIGAIAALLALPQVVVADTLHVPGEYPTIQAAVTAAVEGDTVLVADGIYTGPGNVNVTFLGKAIAVQSENGPATTIIDCEGASRGFRFMGGEGADAVLSGFTIANGVAQGLGPFAGGIWIQGSGPTIQNCVFSNCYGWDGGGAIFVSNGSPTITGSTFAGNYADFYGGAILIEFSTVTIDDCVFNSNIGLAFGGAIYVFGANASLKATNCAFTGQDGTAIHISSASADSSITNCLFAGNVHGGLRLNGPTTSIVNSTFALNAASVPAGVYTQNGVALVDNCILWDNSSLNDAPSTPNEINVGENVVNNSIVQGGWRGEGDGVIDADPLFATGPAGNWTSPATFDVSTGYTVFTDADATFEPGTLAGLLVNPNTKKKRLLFIADNTETTVLVLGNVSAGYQESGKLAHAPIGDEPYEVVNLRPSVGSPAIDTGNDEAVPAGVTTDLDGNARFVGEAVDMGAYEFQGSIVGDLNADGTVDGADLALLLGAWGSCNDCETCIADLDQNCTVDGADLAILLGNWS